MFCRPYGVLDQCVACIHLAYDMPSRLLKKACLISITECVAVSYLLSDYIDLALKFIIFVCYISTKPTTVYIYHAEDA